MECIVKANRRQLENVGVSYDITELHGKVTHKYPTGFYEVEITHKINDREFTNKFDIPKTMLEIK